MKPSPLPTNLSFAEGAAIPVPFYTAYVAVHHKAALKAGETVLISAGGGGVGVAAIQLAKVVSQLERRAPMKAMLTPQFGRPENLRLDETPAPQLREGHVLIRVKATGINPADLVRMSGRYPQPLPLPYIHHASPPGECDGWRDETSCGPRSRRYLYRAIRVPLRRCDSE